MLPLKPQASDFSWKFGGNSIEAKWALWIQQGLLTQETARRDVDNKRVDRPTQQNASHRLATLILHLVENLILASHCANSKIGDLFTRKFANPRTTRD